MKLADDKVDVDPTVFVGNTMEAAAKRKQTVQRCVHLMARICSGRCEPSTSIMNKVFLGCRPSVSWPQKEI